MEPYRLRLALLLSMAGLSLMPQAARADLSAEETASIRTASRKYVEAMRRNDWAAVVDYFTPDAVRMPPNQPMHQGREAIQRWFSRVEQVSQYDLTLEAISGGSGLAYVRTTYRITLLPEGASAPITDQGKALEVWRRDPDGMWRMSAAIWNSDLPIPATQP